MSLRLRVGALGLLFAIVLGAATFAVLTTLADEEDSRAEVRDRVQPASDAGRELLAGLVDQETGARGYVITGREAFLEPDRLGQREAARALDRVAELIRDPATRAAAARVRARIVRWRAAGPNPEIAARRAGETERAQAIVRRGAGKRRFDALRVAVEGLQRRIDAQVARANARADEEARDLRTQLAGAGVALGVLLALTLLLARRWVLTPLRRLQRALRGVTAGDLGRRIPASGPPEMVSLARDTEAMRRRILDELERARGANQALEQRGPVVAELRRQLAPSRERLPDGVVVAGVLQPVEGVLAGDWYDAVVLPGGAVALLVVDVSGHGAEAGLVALRLKHTLSLALRLGRAPEEALALGAEDLERSTERFATCVIVAVDPASGRLSWANAGHPAPLLIDAGRVVAELGPTGPLLSAMGGTWRAAGRALGPGEMVLAYTDGLTEARRDGKGFGEERVRLCVAEAEDRSPAGVVDACVAAVQAHATERRDDITVAAIQADSPAASPSGVRQERTPSPA